MTDSSHEQPALLKQAQGRGWTGGAGWLAFALGAGLLCGSTLWCQEPAPASAGVAVATGVSSPAARAHGQLLLVLPFESQAAQPSQNLDWIGAAVPEILNRRLASAGLSAYQSRRPRLCARPSGAAG